jgi:hypothetical protein
MSDSEDVEECGYSFDTKEGICTNPGVYSDGRCGYHTESDESDYSDTRVTNYKHGLQSGDYYNSLTEEEQNFIDAMADDLLEKSYYTKNDTSMVEKCRQIAVDIHQKRRADGYIGRKGMTQENTVGVHEQYGEITETEENTLFITKDRLSRESRLSMKDLGILDQEKNTNDGSEKSAIERLSEDL